MAAAVDPTPQWSRTGYRFFPYAARQSGTWWVLRRNHGFPEHDLYTLFIDGDAVADLTGDAAGPSRLLAGVATLEESATPQLDPDVAQSVVRRVAAFVNYGSERDAPCDFCSTDDDGMARR